MGAKTQTKGAKNEHTRNTFRIGAFCTADISSEKHHVFDDNYSLATCKEAMKEHKADLIDASKGAGTNGFVLGNPDPNVKMTCEKYTVQYKAAAISGLTDGVKSSCNDGMNGELNDSMWAKDDRERFCDCVSKAAIKSIPDSAYDSINPTDKNLADKVMAKQDKAKFEKGVQQCAKESPKAFAKNKELIEKEHPKDSYALNFGISGGNRRLKNDYYSAGLSVGLGGKWLNVETSLWGGLSSKENEFDNQQIKTMKYYIEPALDVYLHLLPSKWLISPFVVGGGKFAIVLPDESNLNDCVGSVCKDAVTAYNEKSKISEFGYRYGGGLLLNLRRGSDWDIKLRLTYTRDNNNNNEISVGFIGYMF